MTGPQGAAAQAGRWTWPVLVAVAVLATNDAVPAPVAVITAAPTATARGPLADEALRPAIPIDVVELTATRVGEDLRAGRYTVVELTRAFLDRIARYEDHYNAFISMNPEALAIAAALDDEFRATGPRSPLHGVPVVVKDNMDYAGLVTTAGFDGFSAATGGIDMIPGGDAVVVERLKDAGAVILGKTNMHEWANGGTTINPFYGTTVFSVDPATGAPHYALQRLAGVPNVFASPVGAAGRVYIAGRDGTTLVIRHGPRYEVLAANTLDDAFDASPALVDDEVYLRGYRHLYKIAAPGGR